MAGSPTDDASKEKCLEIFAKNLGLEYSEDGSRPSLQAFTVEKADIRVGELKFEEKFNLVTNLSEFIREHAIQWGIKTKGPALTIGAHSARTLPVIDNTTTPADSQPAATAPADSDSTAAVTTASTSTKTTEGKSTTTTALSDTVDSDGLRQIETLARNLSVGSAIGGLHTNFSGKAVYTYFLVFKASTTRYGALRNLKRNPAMMISAGGEYVYSGEAYSHFTLIITIKTTNKLDNKVDGLSFAGLMSFIDLGFGFGAARHDRDDSYTMEYSISTGGYEPLLTKYPVDATGKARMKKLYDNFCDQVKEGNTSFGFKVDRVYPYSGLKKVRVWLSQYQSLAGEIAKIPSLEFLLKLRTAKLAPHVSTLTTARTEVKARITELTEPGVVVMIHEEQEYKVFQELIQNIYNALQAFKVARIVVPECPVYLKIKMPFSQEEYYLKRGEGGPQAYNYLIFSKNIRGALALYFEAEASMSDEKQYRICFFEAGVKHYLKIAKIADCITGLTITTNRDEANIWSCNATEVEESFNYLMSGTMRGYQLCSGFFALFQPTRIFDGSHGHDSYYAQMTDTRSSPLTAKVNLEEVLVLGLSDRLGATIGIINKMGVKSVSNEIPASHGSALQKFHQILILMGGLLDMMLAYNKVLMGLTKEELSKNHTQLKEKIAALEVFEETSEVYEELRVFSIQPHLFDGPIRQKAVIDYNNPGIIIEDVELIDCFKMHDKAQVSRFQLDRGIYYMEIKSHGHPWEDNHRHALTGRVIALVKVKNKNNPRQQAEIKRRRDEIAALAAKLMPEDFDTLNKQRTAVIGQILANLALLQQLKFMINNLRITNSIATAYVDDYTSCQVLEGLEALAGEDEEKEVAESARAAYPELFPITPISVSVSEASALQTATGEIRDEAAEEATDPSMPPAIAVTFMATLANTMNWVSSTIFCRKR